MCCVEQSDVPSGDTSTMLERRRRSSSDTRQHLTSKRSASITAYFAPMRWRPMIRLPMATVGCGGTSRRIRSARTVQAWLRLQKEIRRERRVGRDDPDCDRLGATGRCASRLEVFFTPRRGCRSTSGIGTRGGPGLDVRSRYDAALAEIETALRLDPESLSVAMLETVSGHRARKAPAVFFAPTQRRPHER